MNDGGQITVLVVDDHPVVRDGIRLILSTEEDIEVVGEVATVAEAITAYRSLRPRVILCDLLLPDANGAELVKEVASKSSETHVIVLTMVAGDEQIYRVLEAGARGVLFKDMARKELVRAIRAVAAGRRYVPSEVGSRLAENLPRSGLSAREVEVLQLIAGGMRNKEVAYQLSISEATVNAHVKHILEKLNSTDRTQAVVTALRRGLLHL